MAIKAITIDFYGTLVRDNNAVVRDICRRVSQSAVKMLVAPADVGIAWWRVIEEMIKSGTFYDSKTLEKTALQKIIAQFNSVEDVDELYNEVMSSLRRPILYSDTQTFLDNLPLPFLIIENCDTDILEDALYYSMIESENHITSSDVQAYKPSLTLFKEAIKKLELKPNEILHVGSSLKYDIAPAKKLGLNTCWLNRLKKPKKGRLIPDIECNTLLDLRMIIK